ncbi:ATP-binding protein, partial [Candidatus Sumerlaeota bacterium]|nr:ATP-binding protein [Candidatus Sumerlaeota bacterium]
MKGLNVQMLFNPQSCSLEILEATLTEKRRKLAETILSQIEDSIASKGSHNNLIIGPRGTGKTHVLHYIRRILREKRYPGNDVCNVIALSEDERGITSMLHFLIACLRAAGVENEKLIIMLDPDDRVRAVEDAENLFRQITRQKPTLLIMENLSDIFDGLGKEDMPKLRAFLQSNPYISILASSIFLFKESNKPDHPFYGYFSIHPLPFLDSREAREFLILLSKVNDKNNLNSILNTDLGQRRVNAIHHLTGGNHRLLSMLSHFLNSEGLDELVAPFQQMVDRELTPYYQQRL